MQQLKTEMNQIKINIKNSIRIFPFSSFHPNPTNIPKRVPKLMKKIPNLVYFEENTSSATPNQRIKQ